MVTVRSGGYERTDTPRSSTPYPDSKPSTEGYEEDTAASLRRTLQASVLLLINQYPSRKTVDPIIF